MIELSGVQIDATGKVSRRSEVRPIGKPCCDRDTDGDGNCPWHPEKLADGYKPTPDAP